MIRYFRAPFVRAWIGALALLGLAGTLAADQEILLEDLRAKVLRDDTLAYEIFATAGSLGEKSRIIDLEEPTVRIYNQQGELRDEVTGRTGRFWPETIVRQYEDGTAEEITKYDWALEGGVTFMSQDGMSILTPSMRFSHEVGLIRSNDGVEYKIPTGRGSLMKGTAQQFETTMGEGGSAFKTWTLIGDVHLKTEPTE